MIRPYHGELSSSEASGRADAAVGVIAVVGRPMEIHTLSTGYSGTAAIVERYPGVTRDRVSLMMPKWVGTDFKIVDTGGWESDVEGIESTVFQAQVAIGLADAVIPCC